MRYFLITCYYQNLGKKNDTGFIERVIKSENFPSKNDLIIDEYKEFPKGIDLVVGYIYEFNNEDDYNSYISKGKNYGQNSNFKQISTVGDITKW